MRCNICGKGLREGTEGCRNSPDPHSHYDIRFAEITVCGNHSESDIIKWLREKVRWKCDSRTVNKERGWVKMIWRAVYSTCPNCGNPIGVTDYPSGIWGVAHCKRCGRNFSAARIMGEIVHVDEKEAKKIACIQSIFHIETDDRFAIKVRGGEQK